MRRGTFVLSLWILTTGCSMRLFDESVRQEHMLDLPEDDPKIRELQFFVSERIVMRREAKLKKAQVKSGRLLHRKKRYVEEIVIPAGTPCIAVVADERTIKVAFAGDVVLPFVRRVERCRVGGARTGRSASTSTASATASMNALLVHGCCSRNGRSSA
jgi:hypothetical protein